MSPQLDDMAYRAKAEPRAVFTALAHVRLAGTEACR